MNLGTSDRLANGLDQEPFFQIIELGFGEPEVFTVEFNSQSLWPNGILSVPSVKSVVLQCI